MKRGRIQRQFAVIIMLFVFAWIVYTSFYYMAVSKEASLVTTWPEAKVYSVGNDEGSHLKVNSRNTTTMNILSVTGIQSRHLNYYRSILYAEGIVNGVNCKELVNGNNDKIKYTIQNDMNRNYIDISADEYVKMSANCASFRLTRNYITNSLTDVEDGFPIAFSMIVHRDIVQYERLLRAIYRPQNYYCVHVDLNCDTDFLNAVTAINDCFPNVLMPKERVRVRWGHITVVEPELICMKLLLEKSKLWKYFINLSGQDFPLRTNYQLVNILKSYNGANDIWGTWDKKWNIRWKGNGIPPHNIVPVKGSSHIVVCRGFVDYVINNQKAKDFFKWVANTTLPDETFFPSLNHNPHLNIPGSYKGDLDGVKSFAAHLNIWKSSHSCEGKYIRDMCILGIRHLPALATSRRLFASKFFWDYQRPAYECLERLIYNRTWEEYLDKLDFDVSLYGSRDIVLNQISH